MLADDLGYGDPGCYGNRVLHTPHIDQLAEEGVRLTDFYMSSPVCSPSRASLMTGRCLPRHGLTGVITTHDHETTLSLEEVLLPELLQKRGYRTGLVGKWHLGEAAAARPNSRGYDYFFGGLLGGKDFFTHDFVNGQHDLFENNKPVHRKGEYITDLHSDAATAFIRRNKERPFFLFLSFNAVHKAMGPVSQNKVVQAPRRWLDYYKRKGIKDEQDRFYFACASAMDECIGEVMAELKKQNLDERTFVFFTSDNGPEARQAGTSSPLRGSKQEMWEGGLRVPAIARWRGKIPAGEIRQQPGIVEDLFPTALKIAGIGPPKGLVLDGRNVMPTLIRNESGEARDLIWSYIRWSKHRVVRRDQWVMHNGELFDLEKDLRQEKNVAAQHRELTAELETAWTDWMRQFPKEQKRWKKQLPPRGK